MLKKILILSAIILIVNGQSYEEKIVFNETIPECDYNNKEELINFENHKLINILNIFELNDKVKCLNLQNNLIEQVQAESFIKLPNLRYINLSKNNISSLFFDVSGFLNVEKLILNEAFQEARIVYDEKGHVKKLGGVFPLKTKLLKLKYIYLRNNYIEKIDNDLLKKYLPNIILLDLSHNRIDDICFLNNAPTSLTHVNLNDNFIKHSLYSLDNLEVLFMKNHQIYILYSNINEMYLRGMYLYNAKKLKKFSLSHGQLGYIESHAMKYLENLIELDLSYNYLNEIQDNVFDSMKNLEILNLNSNKLKYIFNICQLKNLKILTLSNNLISRIDSSFKCNKQMQLKYLYFNMNVIADISAGAFDSLTLLEQVNLSDNKLQRLPDNLTDSLINLSKLYLTNNQFLNSTRMSLDGYKGRLYL